ncbi:MFS transporter [Cellulosimicrobium cellulans]|uniref:MFS transporter n=1 Tax=Cellulosimicrobium cellulans TaxID=1710 RepID=UPI0008492A09|nr:MFS transporter [Cellulosimicrobium cellulans]
MSSIPVPTTTENPSTIDDPRRRRSILLAVSLALMAVVASVSGLNVAQPHLALELSASQGEVLWMINTYTVTLAALLLPLGAVGDRWGRRPVLLVGLLVFGVANLAAGVAPTVEVMLAARVASGVGAALVMPVTLSVITSTFPDEERSKAIGVWTAVAGGGGILGMYLSALLVDVADWRLLFVLPVLLVVVAAVVALRSVPDSREHSTHRYDVVGGLTSAAAAVGFTVALHEGPEQGWSAPAVVVSLVLALLATVGFVLWELRTPAPLLDVRGFRTRGLSTGSTLLLVMFGVQAGVSLVLYPFFQVVLGWSGLLSTLALMPMALLMMLMSGAAPRVAARVGARATMATGVLVAAAGLATMASLVSADGGYLTVLPGLVAMGVGTGLAMTPSTEAITSSLPRDQQGVASALNDLTRELGAALGIALLGGLLTAGYRAAIEPRLDGVPDAIAETAREGVAHAVAASADAGPASAELVRAAQESFVTGWQQSMWIGAAVMAVMVLLVLLRGPRREPVVATPAADPCRDVA